MNEKELFNAFLCDATLTHPLSRRKFMVYAVEAWLNGYLMGDEEKDALRATGMNEKQIERLCYLF